MLTIKQISAKISGIAKRNATLRDDIQVVLINSAAHALESRDVTSFTRLFNGVVGADRVAIGKWINEFGLARLDAKDGTFKLNKSAHKDCAASSGDDLIEWLTDNAPKWYDNAKDAKSVASELDVARRLETLAKSIEKAANEDKAITMSGEAITLALVKVRKALQLAADKRAHANRGSKYPTAEEACAEWDKKAGAAPMIGEMVG